MVSLNGLDRIARKELAPKISLGLVMSLMPTTCIPGLNAPTRVVVIAPLEPATASQVMMVLLANVLYALITVMTVEHAGLRSIWLLRQVALTLPLGMP